MSDTTPAETEPSKRKELDDDELVEDIHDKGVKYIAPNEDLEEPDTSATDVRH